MVEPVGKMVLMEEELGKLEMELLSRSCGVLHERW